MAKIFQSVANLFRPTQQVSGVSAPAPAPAAGVPAAPPKPADPLDQIAAVWKNDPTKSAPADPLAGPILNPDQAKISTAIDSMDLMAGIDKALLERVQGGNDPAAIMELIQKTSQNTLKVAAQVSANTTESGLQRQTQRIVAALPAQFRQHEINSAVASNATLQHAAAAPFLNMTRAKIAADNPTMSSTEVNARAEQTLMGFAAALVAPGEDAGYREGGLAPQGRTNGQKDTDWEAWAGI